MIKHGKFPVEEVILHTAATPGSWWKGKTAGQMRDEIDVWHKARGWRMIGYHRVIAPDGTVANGRSIYEPGAHVSGHNSGTIGICMIPIKTHNGITRFEDYFTEAQRVAVLAYIEELNRLTPIKRVTGHNQYANKECPGFRVVSAEWLPGAFHRPDVEPATTKPRGVWAVILDALRRILRGKS